MHSPWIGVAALTTLLLGSACTATPERVPAAPVAAPRVELSGEVRALKGSWESVSEGDGYPCTTSGPAEGAPVDIDGPTAATGTTTVSLGAGTQVGTLCVFPFEASVEDVPGRFAVRLGGSTAARFTLARYAREPSVLVLLYSGDA